MVQSYNKAKEMRVEELSCCPLPQDDARSHCAHPPTRQGAPHAPDQPPHEHRRRLIAPNVAHPFIVRVRNRRGSLTTGFTMRGASRTSKVAVTSSRSPLLAECSGIETSGKGTCLLPTCSGLRLISSVRYVVMAKVCLHLLADVHVRWLAGAVDFPSVASFFFSKPRVS